MTSLSGSISLPAGKHILYVYPMWHTVSFTLIAKKHVEHMRKAFGIAVQELDELAFTSFVPSLRYTAFVHPWMFIYHRFINAKLSALSESLRDRLDKYIEWWRTHFEQLIAVDVCDSDRLSDYAVSLLNHSDKIIVPSSFCVDVYRGSGVKKPVHRVPHGVDPEWYTTPNVWETAPVKVVNPALLELFLYKFRKGKKFLLFWLMHSGARKGWPEVREVYSRLARERRDVVLVLKTAVPYTREFQEVMHLGALQVYGWLSDYEKMALYDLADVTLNFSRGGGFELNCLESLARGVPCIASNWGSWTDYAPEFLRVRTGERVQPLPNNAIHVGYGYKVDVEDALNKIHSVLESYEELRARVEEWRSRLANVYRWDRVAQKLLELALGVDTQINVLSKPISLGEPHVHR